MKRSLTSSQYSRINANSHYSRYKPHKLNNHTQGSFHWYHCSETYTPQTKPSIIQVCMDKSSPSSYDETIHSNAVTGRQRVDKIAETPHTGERDNSNKDPVPLQSRAESGFCAEEIFHFENCRLYGKWCNRCTYWNNQCSNGRRGA